MTDINEKDYKEEIEEFKKHIKQEIEEYEVFAEYQDKKMIKEILEECYPHLKPFDKWVDFEE